MTDSLGAQIAGLDWTTLAVDLDARGWARIPGLLDREVCREATELYASSDRFRSHIVMARHGFGRGEYRYFAYPLPALVEELRSTLYPHLVPIANRWHEQLGFKPRFPADHTAFLARCHAAGQRRSTPLMLQYGPGDYNCLHQDLYGEHVFPLQVAILLSEPEMDFSGGEFVLTEQRPRAQSRVEVVPLEQGDAVLFAVNFRPRTGANGDYRVTMRHGVSTVREGQRHTLGIIFHDAA